MLASLYSKYGAAFLSRCQQAASSLGLGTVAATYRRGEAASSYTTPELVLAMEASACASITARPAAPQDGKSVFLTSVQVRFAHARNAVMFWLSAGAPTTQATRLPFRSVTVLMPASPPAATFPVLNAPPHAPRMRTG